MKLKDKKMLIVGSGGLRGAYTAGVLAELCRKLGPDYFDVILASSVGVYAATFYIANQPDTIENTWRNYVDSEKLVCFYNMLKDKEVLNLEYLSNIFQNYTSRLNLKKVIKSKVNLKYILTDYQRAKAYFVKPNKKNIFKLMNASCALFPLHTAIKIKNKTYIDGGLAEPLPFKEKFARKYIKVVVVHNKEEEYKERKITILLFKLLAKFVPKNLQKLMNFYFDRLEKIKSNIKKYDNVFLLTPSKKLPLKSLIDTDKERLNKSVDLGIKDAKQVIEFLKK